METPTLIFLTFLLSAIPGIYLATKKYFLIFHNRKYDLFIIKLIYCVPAMVVWT